MLLLCLTEFCDKYHGSLKNNSKSSPLPISCHGAKDLLLEAAIPTAQDLTDGLRSTQAHPLIG
jgi:hypothetical protein